MTTINIIGIGASVLTGISLLPQLVKMIKEKKAGNVSVGMLAILFGGLSLWAWYGILKNDWIIVVSNAFSLVINITLAVLAFKYKNNK